MTRAFTFVGGNAGAWQVVRIVPVIGEALERVPSLAVVNRSLNSPPSGAKWLLRGVTSHERYVTRDEHALLAAKTPALGRAEATCAALIPIKKSASWWDLAQDERRAIFESRSEHIKMGLQYLPAVARRLHHCRDLAIIGESESGRSHTNAPHCAGLRSSGGVSPAPSWGL